MNQSIPNPADQQKLNYMMNVAALQRLVKAGANNFHWIAGLSIINTLIFLFSTTTHFVFVIGLGITQFIDGFAYGLSQRFASSAVIFRGIGFLLDLFFAGILILFGYFAGKGKKWAFITGMVLYGLDAILVIAFKDIISFAFYLFFLFLLLKGLQALNKLGKVVPQTVSDPSFPKDIGA